MGSNEEKQDLITTPTLHLFCNTNTHALPPSPPRSGTLTPPLYSSTAAVPFRWEEQPGKPRGSTSFNALTVPKCLELPPRLLLDPNAAARLNSPTTVFEGPYRFQSSSFRIVRREWYGSFRRSCSPEKRQLIVSRGLKDGGFLGSWRWGRKGFRGKREGVNVGPGYVFPNCLEEKQTVEEDEEMGCGNNNVKITRIRQSGGFSRSRFWATVYGSLKQAVPWRSKKPKKEEKMALNF